MLIKIDHTVLNTDHIKMINVDENGKFVVVYFDDEFSRTFNFLDRESQERFLKTIGLNTYFA